MDNNENFDNIEMPSFGKAVAQTFVISAAAMAGTFVGMMAIGYAIGKIEEFTKNRASKKETKK